MDRTYIDGIDQPLPEGERLLWQGRPSARGLARDVFRVHWIAIYFVGLAALSLVLAGSGAAVGRAVWLMILGAVVVGIAALYSRWVASSTIYAFTDRRIVMKIGVAFPAVFNLPFSRIGGAWHRAGSDGTGDVALDVVGSDRIGVAYLWPHARPWRFRNPQPMMRAIPDAPAVAAHLRDVLLEAGVGHPTHATTTPVEFNVLDDDGTVILTNRVRAGSEPQ